MHFKTLPVNLILKALEGQENILTPAAEKHVALFKTLACPVCGGKMVPFLNPKSLYQEGAILPTYLARCSSCGCEFNPAGTQLEDS